MISNSKLTENSDSSYMPSILVCRLLKAMQPARSLLCWTDDLHKIFVEAVEYQEGSYGPCRSRMKAKASSCAGDSRSPRSRRTRTIPSAPLSAFFVHGGVQEGLQGEAPQCQAGHRV